MNNKNNKLKFSDLSQGDEETDTKHVVLEMNTKNEITSNVDVNYEGENENPDLSWSAYYYNNKTTIVMFTIWFFWLTIGTAYYSLSTGMTDDGEPLGFYKGIYMAVNSGYSIGWGYPYEHSSQSMIFSTFFVLVGSSLVAACLGFFAQGIVDDADNWYVNAIQQNEYDEAQHSNSSWVRWKSWFQFYSIQINSILLWVLWIVVATVWALLSIEEWDFPESILFAISSLSTGGLLGIPSDSPDYYFGLVALYAGTGVPVMGIAMGSVASFFISTESVEDTLEVIKGSVTDEEIEMMCKFGIDDGDGEISLAEYIIFSMVRIGAADPGLVTLIKDHYK
jgi:hypothetical protein